MKYDGGPFDPEPLRAPGRDGKIRLGIDDGVAGPADQVMMVVDLSVEPGAPVSAGDFLREAPFHQRGQYPVHGGPGEIGKGITNLVVNLVRRGMIVPPDERFENDPPLRGQGKSPVATSQFQIFQGLIVHENGCWLVIIIIQLLRVNETSPGWES